MSNIHTDAIRQELVDAMGMHGKAELAVERVLPEILGDLKKRITDLEERVHAIEHTDRVPGGLP